MSSRIDLLPPCAVGLTSREMLDMLFNMKKQVTSREFLHGFAKVHESLQPGETVTITRHGKPLGKFTKEAAVSAIALPNFLEEARATGFGTKVGDELMLRMLRDEAVS
jgi:antitoxin (DNA-binding transcriptional repressor) of toxin-antitoxin stability system